MKVSKLGKILLWIQAGLASIVAFLFFILDATKVMTTFWIFFIVVASMLITFQLTKEK